MADVLKTLHRHRATGWLARALGLPHPADLARHAGPYDALPFQGMRALLGRTDGGYAADALAAALACAGAEVAHALPQDEGERERAAMAPIVVMDATGCRSAASLRALYDTFHPAMRHIAPNGRVLIVAALPGEATDAVAAAAARGLEGFTRSLAKELGRKGSTANLVYLARGAVDRLDGVVRFFCGVQSTYVSGQAITVSALVHVPAALPFAPALAGKVALVTGAARGIGLAVAERLAQEGARVVGVDVPGAAGQLHAACARLGGVALALDIAAQDAPAQLTAFLQEHGGVDIVVHNAGITRDRTLARMDGVGWDAVIGVNFGAIAAIDTALLARGLLRDEGRMVCLSSISGVAGNAGQTNYALTKAALIGYVAALAPQLAPRGICVNAVAPGFIETAMVAKMPFLTRALGRRLNAVQQGGVPRDVAELITFLCTPGAVGISGNTIRVCGQALIGA